MPPLARSLRGPSGLAGRTVPLLALFATVGSLLACIRFPSELAANALDYRIDRPIVAGVRLDPPVLAHDLPVQIDALLLTPPGTEGTVTRVAICGLRDDLVVEVDEEDCFNEPDLVDEIGDHAPVQWNPPSLAGLPCPTYNYGYYEYPEGAPYADTGVPDTADTSDTGDTAVPPPTWNVGSCGSTVPLLVTAQAGDVTFFGRIQAYLRVEPYAAGEFVPAPVWELPRSLTYTGDAVAGGEVELTFSVDSAIDDEGFRWWVDGGELLGTGRTALHNVSGATRITHNTLRIPDDWHGPLRVFVVIESADSDNVPYSADLAWESITLEVP